MKAKRSVSVTQLPKTFFLLIADVKVTLPSQHPGPQFTDLIRMESWVNISGLVGTLDKLSSHEGAWWPLHPQSTICTGQSIIKMLCALENVKQNFSPTTLWGKDVFSLPPSEIENKNVQLKKTRNGDQRGRPRCRRESLVLLYVKQLRMLLNSIELNKIQTFIQT